MATPTLEEFDDRIFRTAEALSITYKDRSQTNRSVDDMLKLRALLAGMADPNRAGYRVAACSKAV